MKDVGAAVLLGAAVEVDAEGADVGVAVDVEVGFELVPVAVTCRVQR